MKHIFADPCFCFGDRGKTSAEQQGSHTHTPLPERGHVVALAVPAFLLLLRSCYSLRAIHGGLSMAHPPSPSPTHRLHMPQRATSSAQRRCSGWGRCSTERPAADGPVHAPLPPPLQPALAASSNPLSPRPRPRSSRSSSLLPIFFPALPLRSVEPKT